MVQINPNNKKYLITFKRKDLRPNQRDDKFEIFRNAVGLRDVSDILDIMHDYTGHHMTTPITKTDETISDINSFHSPIIIAKLSPDQALRLKRDPNILTVEKDDIVYPEIEGWQWGVEAGHHAAQPTWASPLGVRGSGVNLAIIDDGMYVNHPDLKANVRVNQDFAGTSTGLPNGDNYHGTHCGGIAAAVEGNGIGVQGMAPSCNLWNLKVDEPGIGMAWSNIAEAMAYAFANNCHVTSMSFGNYFGDAAIATMIREAWDVRNIVPFAAAGNDNIANPHYPSSYYGAISIAAIDQNHAKAYFSNFGPNIDFTAAGMEILSCGPVDTYVYAQGTSMACPCAAGLGALAVSAYKPNACPPYDTGLPKNQLILNLMKQTALQLSGPPGTRNNTFGYGMPIADKLCAALLQVS